MAANSMDVFSLRHTMVHDYEQFATSFTTIHADDLGEPIEKIYATDRCWPEPLIQISPSYRRSTNVAALAAAGEPDARCAEILCGDGDARANDPARRSAAR